MKMAYETPKMRAELFQAAEYVAACSNPFIEGFLRVQEYGKEIWHYFFGGNKLMMLNQNQPSMEQYFYKKITGVELDANGNVTDYDNLGANDTMYYLEYSAPHDRFVLYQEAGANSGYYTNNGFVSGANSLQANDGDTWTTPDFKEAAGDVYRIPDNANSGLKSTQYYEYDLNTGAPVLTNGEYTTLDANGWYADECLGVVGDMEALNGYKVVNS